jgi:hypothetical protein
MALALKMRFRSSACSKGPLTEHLHEFTARPSLAFLLSLSGLPRLSRDIAENAGFLCDRDAVFGGRQAVDCMC